MRPQQSGYHHAGRRHRGVEQPLLQCRPLPHGPCHLRRFTALHHHAGACRPPAILHPLVGQPDAHVLSALPLLSSGAAQHLVLSRPVLRAASRSAGRAVRKCLRVQPEVRAQGVPDSGRGPHRLLLGMGLLRAVFQSDHQRLWNPLAHRAPGRNRPYSCRDSQVSSEEPHAALRRGSC